MGKHYLDDYGRWVLFHIVVYLAMYAVLGVLAWIVIQP